MQTQSLAQVVRRPQAHPELQLLRSNIESFDEACARLDTQFKVALTPVVNTQN